MDLWNLLLDNNASLLIFSASGFLLSLFWYVLSERRRRFQFNKKEQDIAESSAFFGHFDDIENPALKIPEFTIKDGPGRSVLPLSVNAKKPVHSNKDQAQADKASEETKPTSKAMGFTSELDRKLSSLLPDLPEETKSVASPERQSANTEDREQLKEDEDDDERLIEEFLAATAKIEKTNQEQSLSENLEQAEAEDAEETEAKDAEDISLEAQTLSQDAKDMVDEEDEDDKTVREFLEKIKKDMREQGEHTS